MKKSLKSYLRKETKKENILRITSLTELIDGYKKRVPKPKIEKVKQELKRKIYVSKNGSILPNRYLYWDHKKRSISVGDLIPIHGLSTDPQSPA